jgi:ubiquinone/menaquinone biosynthesis C-methylase UbiE
MADKDHWENVYANKQANSVSWFQEHADRSLALIKGIGVPPEAWMIDIGGGASNLVDDSLREGQRHICVLDLSARALNVARDRLGQQAEAVLWIEGDITDVELPAKKFDLWHDRAVFHFLTEAADRAAYIDQAMRSVKLGGHLIVATFALEGPTQCSGLPIVRYSPESLHYEFGAAFQLIKHGVEEHRTPMGNVQQFIYCHFVKVN